MSRAVRVAGGWGVALVAALVLSIFLSAPLAPDPAVLAGAVSPTPNAALDTPIGADLPPPPTEVRPPFPHWPPAAWHTGPAGAVRFTQLPASSGAQLQAAVDRAREGLGLMALTVGVAVDGRSYWAGASGVAMDGATALDGDSPFAIASITKTFTAALIMELVERGRLSLDTEVATVLPEVAVPAGVTIRHLLEHTSGIADLLAPMRKPMEARPGHRFTSEAVIGRLPKPWFSPGANFGYSNSNYVLLGMVVERLYDRPFEDVLRRHLLRPLHLDETGVLLADGAPRLMTPSWASAFGTSGNMYSSASDLLEWGTALYGGRVLDADTVQQMVVFNDEDYGLGTELIHLRKRSGVGHTGLLRGYTSMLVHLPRERITLAVIGAWQGFDPRYAVLYQEEKAPSVLDVAVRVARQVR
jgi:CubicO group peptidase (beta-lactamase class C family)